MAKLSPEQYWKWRTAASEMNSAAIEAKYKFQSFQMAEKDIEIAKLRNVLYKQVVQTYQDRANQSKVDYDELKAQLEVELGVSLKDAVIDDITFEIKPLEDVTGT